MSLNSLAFLAEYSGAWEHACSTLEERETKRVERFTRGREDLKSMENMNKRSMEASLRCESSISMHRNSIANCEDGEGAKRRVQTSDPPASAISLKSEVSRFEQLLERERLPYENVHLDDLKRMGESLLLCEKDENVVKVGYMASNAARSVHTIKSFVAYFRAEFVGYIPTLDLHELIKSFESDEVYMTNVVLSRFWDRMGVSRDELVKDLCALYVRLLFSCNVPEICECCATGLGIIARDSPELGDVRTWLRNYANPSIRILSSREMDKIRHVYFRSVFAAACSPDSKVKFDECWAGMRARALEASGPAETELWLRDMRGVAAGPASCEAFDRMLSAFMGVESVVMRAVARSGDGAAKALFRMVFALVSDEGRRITGDPMRVGGLVLFKWMTGVVESLSPSICARKDYKVTRAVLRLVTRALAEPFVNLAVFEVYSDPSLSKLQTSGFGLLMSIIDLASTDGPVDRKLILDVASFVAGFMRFQMEQFTRIPPRIFASIMDMAFQWLAFDGRKVSELAAAIIERTSTHAHRNPSWKPHFDKYQPPHFISLLARLALRGKREKIVSAHCRALFAMIVSFPASVHIDSIVASCANTASQQESVRDTFAAVMSDLVPSINDDMCDAFTKKMLECRKNIYTNWV